MTQDLSGNSGSRASTGPVPRPGPSGFDPGRTENYALGLMVEEMGETLKIIGKALRFGLDAPGPATPEYRGLTAREMLPCEVGDLHAAIRYAAMAGVVRMSLANVAESDKLAKLLNPDSIDANGNRLAPALDGIASVGRNPQGQDPAEGHGRDDEHAVGSEADETHTPQSCTVANCYLCNSADAQPSGGQ